MDGERNFSAERRLLLAATPSPILHAFPLLVFLLTLSFLSLPFLMHVAKYRLLFSILFFYEKTNICVDCFNL